MTCVTRCKHYIELKIQTAFRLNYAQTFQKHRYHSLRYFLTQNTLPYFAQQKAPWWCTNVTVWQKIPRKGIPGCFHDAGCQNNKGWHSLLWRPMLLHHFDRLSVFFIITSLTQRPWFILSCPVLGIFYMWPGDTRLHKSQNKLEAGDRCAKAWTDFYLQCMK